MGSERKRRKRRKRKRTGEGEERAIEREEIHYGLQKCEATKERVREVTLFIEVKEQKKGSATSPVLLLL